MKHKHSGGRKLKYIIRASAVKSGKIIGKLTDKALKCYLDNRFIDVDLMFKCYDNIMHTESKSHPSYGKG